VWKYPIQSRIGDGHEAGDTVDTWVV